MICASIDVIVQTQRLRDGSRRITHITEILGMEGEVATTQDLLVYDIQGEDDDGKLSGDASRYRHWASALLGARAILWRGTPARRRPRRGRNGKQRIIRTKRTATKRYVTCDFDIFWFSFSALQVCCAFWSRFCIQRVSKGLSIKSAARTYRGDGNAAQTSEQIVTRHAKTLD